MSATTQHITGETVGLSISGMTCNGCSSTIEKALVALPSVASASVDHVSGRAVVVLASGADAEAFSFEADEAIHAAGYTLEGTEAVTTLDVVQAENEGCCGGSGCC